MNLDRARQIDGWMFDDELIWLAEVANISKVIIEFGCYKGRSTRALADNTSGKVYAVDPWVQPYYRNDDSVLWNSNPRILEEFKSNLGDLIGIGKVLPFNIPSNEFPFIKNVDFVFIDGDHRYEQVKNDIKIGKRLLANKGGVLAGHDYTHSDWPGVKQAVDESFSTIYQANSIWWVIIDGQH